MIRRSSAFRRRACWAPTDWRRSASSRSSRAIASRPARPAMIAPSLSALASWAPVIPVVLRATSRRSRSGPSGLPLAWARRIASRPSRSGGRDQDLAVEAARAQQRLVELVDVVGGGDHDHRPLLLLEAVELDQELVERLLALAGAAVAAAAGAGAADRVELVDEDHGAAGLAGFLEEAADAGGAAADEHLDEARARGGEEVDPGLGGDGAGEHRLAGPGRAVEEDAARRLGAERREAVRFLEPGGDVDQLVLGGVDALDLLPEDRLGLARLHRFRLGRADRAAQQGDEDQQQRGHEEDPEDRVPVEEEFFDVPSGERLASDPSPHHARRTQGRRAKRSRADAVSRAATWEPPTIASSPVSPKQDPGLVAAVVVGRPELQRRRRGPRP